MKNKKLQLVQLESFKTKTGINPVQIKLTRGPKQSTQEKLKTQPKHRTSFFNNEEKNELKKATT